VDGQLDRPLASSALGRGSDSSRQKARRRNLGTVVRRKVFTHTP